MIRTLIFVLLVFISSSCKKENPGEIHDCLNQFGLFNPNVTEGKGNLDYNFYKGKKIELDQNQDNIYIDLADGNSLVFKYQFTRNDNPNIADDEYSEAIYFEVDQNKESFHYSMDDLEKNHVVFGKFCFCVDGGYHLVDEGCIHGEKISDTKWEVSFSLRINSTWEPIIIMVSSEFKIGDWQ